MSRPRDELGQHLLRDPEAIARIVAVARLQPGETVMDAGAGTGALTHPLAEAVGPSGRVHAVEVDPIMVETLEADLPENARIIQSDLLEVSLRGIDAVVANPPFKILAPFIERVLASNIKRAVLVVPRELADRLTAAPGSERYGSLTVRVGIMADVTFIAPLGRRAFRPAPTIACAVLEIRKREGAIMPDVEALRIVMETALDAWGRKTKYALAQLPDIFRADSARFQQLLRDEAWAEQVVASLPPQAFAAIARHFYDDAPTDA